MIKESWFRRFLKRIGIIKTYEINKKEMCEYSKTVCEGNCESCIWYE